jgi:hypothetical protein
MTASDFTAAGSSLPFTWQEMAPYLTWATTNARDSVAARDAGIRTVMYTDPNHVNITSPLYSSDESEYAHDCSGQRITILNKPVTTYLTDPSSTTLATLWAAQVSLAEQGWGGVYDVIFEDSTDVVTNVSAMPCNFDQTAWTAESLALTASLAAPVRYNGLGSLVDGPSQISPAIGVLPASVGATLEGCYSNGDPTHPMPHSTVWQTYENTEIQVVASGNTFVCRGLSALPDSTSQVYRIYMYASYLLTYSPTTTIFSDAFKTANGFFAVEPESQLVAKNPVAAAPSDISQLIVGTGTYGRQYKNCYYAGKWVGPCAAVVNSDSPTHPHAFPWPTQYHHTMVLYGGDILDGGTASMSGPPPPAEMSGESAVVAFP